MKKLGKKINVQKETLEAYCVSCSCSPCTSCPACYCPVHGHAAITSSTQKGSGSSTSSSVYGGARFW